MMKNLRELRKSKNISLKKLGEIIGVSESAVSQYENSKREPDYKTLSKLADYFGVSTDYLLGRETTPPGDAFALSSDVDYDDLPPEALEEIKQFKEFVKSKYKKKDK